MKFNDRMIAIRLRKKGKTYSRILKKIDVSKSSLSLWLRDIELSGPQKEKILKGREKSRYAGAKIQQKKRVSQTKQIIENAQKEFLILVKNQIFLVGLALYWAEGDKHKGERVKFTNSDPLMISFMMNWFREICKVPETKFRIALHVHNLLVSKKIKSYWSQLTDVPQEQFNKIYVKNSTLRQRRNVLYNGTCGIVINNKSLFRRIVGWKLGLLNHFKISPRSSTDRTEDF